MPQPIRELDYGQTHNPLYLAVKKVRQKFTANSDVDVKIAGGHEEETYAVVSMRSNRNDEDVWETICTKGSGKSHLLFCFLLYVDGKSIYEEYLPAVLQKWVNSL